MIGARTPRLSSRSHKRWRLVLNFKFKNSWYYYFVCISIWVKKRGGGDFESGPWWQMKHTHTHQVCTCVCRGLTATSARSWFSQTINCPRLELSTNQSCLDHCRHPYLFYLPSGRLFTSFFPRSVVIFQFNSIVRVIWALITVTVQQQFGASGRLLLSQAAATFVGHYYLHATAVVIHYTIAGLRDFGQGQKRLINCCGTSYPPSSTIFISDLSSLSRR